MCCISPGDMFGLSVLTPVLLDDDAETGAVVLFLGEEICLLQPRVDSRSLVKSGVGFICDCCFESCMSSTDGAAADVDGLLFASSDINDRYRHT
jgi:hypothetical protein